MTAGKEQRKKPIHHDDVPTKKRLVFPLGGNAAVHHDVSALKVKVGSCGHCFASRAGGS